MGFKADLEGKLGLERVEKHVTVISIMVPILMPLSFTK